MEVPAFSSRAESLMHRLWGGDLIGMTDMPGATLAREVEKSKDELLKEIIGNLAAGTQNAMEVIRRAIRLLAERREQLPPSPAQSALKLGIWSDKGRIDQDEVKRLGPLWMKYF